MNVTKVITIRLHKAIHLCAIQTLGIIFLQFRGDRESPCQRQEAQNCLRPVVSGVGENDTVPLSPDNTTSRVDPLLLEKAVVTPMPTSLFHVLLHKKLLPFSSPKIQKKQTNNNNFFSKSSKKFSKRTEKATHQLAQTLRGV